MPSGRPHVARRIHRIARLRGKAQNTLGNSLLETFSSAARRYHPDARPERHNVEVIHDIPYLDDGLPEHRLDVYRPTRHPGPWPVVLYVHGGGFRMLSKDTHWMMGLAYARQGYMVVNISYRLAPRHPFPAAIADACDALVWIANNAASYGGDLDRLVFAGESAGGNLVTSLSVATCYRRHELFAQRAWNTGLVPRVVVPACAVLQVSDPERFGRRRDMPGWLTGVMLDVKACYLRGWDQAAPRALDLADPLLVFERGDRPDRPLPAFFTPVGTKDPLLDDTRRLDAALRLLGVDSEAAYYEGEIHAFHAMVWRKPARRCWRDIYAFLDQRLNTRAGAVVLAPAVRSATGG